MAAGARLFNALNAIGDAMNAFACATLPEILLYLLLYFGFALGVGVVSVFAIIRVFRSGESRRKSQPSVCAGMRS